jgi:hypothetical protein
MQTDHYFYEMNPALTPQQLVKSFEVHRGRHGRENDPVFQNIVVTEDDTRPLFVNYEEIMQSVALGLPQDSILTNHVANVSDYDVREHLCKSMETKEALAREMETPSDENLKCYGKQKEYTVIKFPVESLML